MDSSIKPADVKSRAKNTYDATQVIWPQTDKWSAHTKKVLEEFVRQTIPKNESVVLNAGCGGNDYGIGQTTPICINFDISLRQCRGIRQPVVADVESIPFANDIFDVVLCVGAVINYCEPYVAIPELFRVAKRGGLVVIDFETTQSAELLLSSHWGKRVSVIDRRYADRSDKTLLFSIEHMKRIVEQNGIVNKVHRYHTATAAWLWATQKAQIPNVVLSLDSFLSRAPVIRTLASNSIFVCQKF
jgi:SAM-dependent methyltransferase